MHTSKYFLPIALFLLLTAFLLFPLHDGMTVPRLLWAFLFALSSYFIFNTNRTAVYRKTLLIVLSAFFMSGFMLFVSSSCIPGVACPVALCTTSFFTVKNLLLNLRYTHYFLGAFLMLGVVFAVGEIWCSWICWFGGIDEGFACLNKKPPLRLHPLPDILSELPSAILLFSILATFSTGIAVFCVWICPLKMSAAVLGHEPTRRLLQIILFVAVGALFLVVLPFFSGKRTFCRLVCPLRALLRWSSGIHPWNVHIVQDKCTRCGKCVEICGSLAIDENYRVSPYCNLCLDCIEVCPDNAIVTNPHPKIMLFFALLVSGIVSSFFIPALLKLALGL